MRFLPNYPRARGYIFFLILLDIIFLIVSLWRPIYSLVPGLQIDLLIIFVGLLLVTIYKYWYFKNKNEQRDFEGRPKKISAIGERAWKYYSEIDKLLHDRVNYFLVAESMLLFSFISAYLTSQEDLIQIRPAIAFVGIVITLIWFYTNRRIRIKMRNLYEIATNKDPLIFDYRRAIKISPTEEVMLTTFLPSSILLLWLYLYAFSIGVNLKYFMEFLLPIFILLLIILFFVIEYIMPPKNPEE
jgi:hypothetical protein